MGQGGDKHSVIITRTPFRVSFFLGAELITPNGLMNIAGLFSPQR